MQKNKKLTIIAATLILGITAGCNVKMSEDAGIHRYDSFYIPQDAFPEPNYATKEYYLKKVLADAWGFGRLASEPSPDPRPLSINTVPNEFLDQQMESTGLISYLFYDNGVVKHDALSGDNRFGRYVDDSTPLWTHSIGKSWTAYLVGHAICQGYIPSVYSRVDDWPLIEDTLYSNQRLLDLMNMRAGDRHVVTERDGLLSSRRWFNNHPVSVFANAELAGTERTGRFYNYNGLVTNIVLNYIFHKTGDDTQEFIDSVFRDHVGSENTIFFLTQRGSPMKLGPVRYSARASRYDFLRVGLAMLDDWNEKNCVGNYLRTLLAESEPKNYSNPRHPDRGESPRRYGGFFHTHYVGMSSRKILGMDGYGGQSQLIDFENHRVVSVNTIHTNYNWGVLVYGAIRHGHIRRN